MCTQTPSTERTLRPYDLYHDIGCDINPVRLGCLSCPLPFCKYDDPGAYRNWQDRQRRKQAMMETEGLSVEDAAQRLGLTVRTIFRYRERDRKEETI